MDNLNLFKEKKKETPTYQCEWEYIQTEDDLVPAYDYLIHLPKNSVLGIDLETHGVLPQFPDHYPRLLQVAISDKFCYLFDLKLIAQDIGGEIEDALRWFSFLFDGRFKLLFQNGKFDIKFLLTYGINFKADIWDTFLADKALTQGLKVDCNLKAIFTRRVTDKIALDKGEQKSNWDSKNLSRSQLQYAAIDACCLHLIYKAQASEGKQKGLFRPYSENPNLDTFRMEFRMVVPIAKLELAGIGMDWDELGVSQERLSQEKDVRWKEFLSLVDEELGKQGKLPLEKDLFGDYTQDPNSPKQGVELLHRIGIKVETLNKDYLMGYFSDNPIIQAYQVAKNAQIEWQDSHKYEPHPTTNRAFGQLKILGTETGRLSSKGYSFKLKGRNYKVGQNIQNPPRDKKFRSLFIPKPGYTFVQCDYSQIQLRIAASIAQDPVMLNAYRNGEDVHKLTASTIANKPLEDVTKQERQMGKPVNFGFIFGMGSNRFIGYAKVSYGTDFTPEEADKYRAKFFELYYGIAGWHKRLTKQTLTETRSNNGRIRYLHAEHKQTLSNLANSPVQGTESDILKDAVINLHQIFIQGYDAQIVNLVHDEVLVEVKESQALEVQNIVQNTMEESGRKFIKDVPIIAESQIIPNWGSK